MTKDRDTETGRRWAADRQSRSGEDSPTPGNRSVTGALAALLALWIGALVLLDRSGALATAAPQAFRPVLIAVIVPIALFLSAYAASPRLRRFVLAQDLAAMTMLQHWRVLGFAFLMLYAYDVLPALFAWPAGFGDIAIGFATPLVLRALARRPGFATGRRFVAFNLLGILDFVVAAGAASLASGAFPTLLSGPATSAPMEAWPLLLFPAFVVPVFTVLHLSVLFQVAARRRIALAPAGPVPHAA
jgi:hypothetical protein